MSPFSCRLTYSLSHWQSLSLSLSVSLSLSLSLSLFISLSLSLSISLYMSISMSRSISIYRTIIAYLDTCTVEICIGRETVYHILSLTNFSWSFLFSILPLLLVLLARQGLVPGWPEARNREIVCWKSCHLVELLVSLQSLSYAAAPQWCCHVRPRRNTLSKQLNVWACVWLWYSQLPQLNLPLQQASEHGTLNRMDA